MPRIESAKINSPIASKEQISLEVFKDKKRDCYNFQKYMIFTELCPFQMPLNGSQNTNGSTAVKLRQRAKMYQDMKLRILFVRGVLQKKKITKCS